MAARLVPTDESKRTRYTVTYVGQLRRGSSYFTEKKLAQECEDRWRVCYAGDEITVTTEQIDRRANFYAVVVGPGAPPKVYGRWLRPRTANKGARKIAARYPSSITVYVIEQSYL